ncbi:hemolysin family protein [Acidipropionibacterium virtanenii]|uniref:Hemolysin C n=1 Tax=Acidipropionibacterium virtanenii TaxID=2057246 RepID=A0A344USI9_9ACTN|nr:hemolysin family protein [Acidipropionibacterium virtanenii]AXE38237.1 Hemolysin C [Acidipropionibacterium virtanenii]
MTEVLSNAALVLLFILVGGVFSAAEMALVTLRGSQIQQLVVTRGSRGRAIQKLVEDPNRFLSSVQIGVTVSGFLASAFGGATLATDLSPVLIGRGVPGAVAGPLSLVLITAVISYFSIVLGELAAKRLAMQRAEGFALVLGPITGAISVAFRPLIWFLGISTDFVVEVLGGDPRAARQEVTEEELRSMVVSSASLGKEERRILDDVFDAGEKSLREVMVPRTEVDFLDGSMTAARAFEVVRDGSHSRYPVTDGSVDQIAGFVHVRDMLVLDPAERHAKLHQLVRPVASLPDSVKLLKALAELRRRQAHLAMVLDEYGGTAGIVTMEDLVEEIVGDITDEYDTVAPTDAMHARQRDIDGLLTLEEFQDRVGLVLPEGPYDTVAGYFMFQYGQVPVKGAKISMHLHAGDTASDQIDEEAEPNVEMTVTELDGRRASWLELRRIGPVPAGLSGADGPERRP